ncbi:MAG: nitroreductase family protein [Candidatus Undinarchaeales archaeon]|jgi:nitroreductase|nr:nitroreductase family protein [Candidatus Undinarchaeales archaeon]MDP7494101.1 nitroreductase family protein [Candidatus Undinarchaeales archaeon]
MDLFDAITSRVSVRSYSDDPVDRDDITKILEAGVRAPNSENQQAWRFVVVQDRDIIERIGRYSQWGAKALFSPQRHALEERFAGMPEEKRKALIEDMTTGMFFTFIGRAPVVIVVLADTSKSHSVHSASAAIENISLAAHGLGLGTCWTMVATGDAAVEQRIRQELGRPEDNWEVAGIITLGHPARMPRPRPRRPLSDVVDWI